MGALSPLHLVVILVVAVLVIGPGKLPETGAAIGKAIRDFRRAMTDEVTAPAASAVERPADSAAASEDPPEPAKPSDVP